MTTGFPHRSPSHASGPLAAIVVVALAAFGAGAGCADSPARIGTDAGGQTGDAGAGGDATLSGQCNVPDPGPLDFIDDMEDGNASIIWRQGRNSEWYTYHDPTDGILVPNQGAAVAMETIPGARCSYSFRAMRVTGSGFSEWGAGFGFDFLVVSGPNGYAKTAYDGTFARGVTFWARVGDPSITAVRFGVGDQWSAPEGGHCKMDVTSGPTACYDSFGALVPLTTEWRRYAFSWTQLGQRMFGLSRPELDTANLFDLHFDIAMSAPVFDVWIDDIAFYR